MVAFHMNMQGVLRLEHHVAKTTNIVARIVLVFNVVDNVILPRTHL